MWSEKLSNGNVRFVERYINPLTGKTGRVSVTAPKDTASTRKAALETLNAKIDEKLRKLGAEPDAEALTLGRLLELYIDYQHLVCKASTYERNRVSIGTTIRHLGQDTLVTSLTAGYVRSRMTAAGIQGGTFNEFMVRFKAMMRWAYENDYVRDVSFLDKIKPLPDDTRREKLEEKYLEKEELARLLEGMKERRWQLLTKFLVLSGLRVGEAIALKRSDIDLFGHTLTVSKTYDYNHDVVTTTKTYTSTREVYMQPELEAVAREILRFSRMVGSVLFFPDLSGDYMHYYDFNKYLKENSKRILGRQLSTHALRHAHVSLMAESGIPLDTIARRLGHSDSKITREIYYHVTKRQEEKDREKIKDVRMIN